MIRVVTVGLALTLGAVACGGSTRPSVAQWAPRWDAVVASVPDLERIGQPPDQTMCDETLAALRSSTGDLAPTPDPAIDEVVDDWARLAEDAFFECPPSSNEVPDFAAAYSELRRLEAEVGVVLEIDS